MRLRVGIIIAIIILGLVGPPPESSAGTAAQGGVARVRFVNAGSDVPPLDVYANGVLWAGGITGDSGYLDLIPGDTSFTFKLTGNAEPLASTATSVEAGQRVTVFALGTRANLEARALVDDVSAPARNAARVRFVHAVPGADAVRVRLDGDLLDGELAWGSASDPAQVIAGPHDIEILTAGDRVLLSALGQRFEANRAYTLFLTGQGEGLRLLATSSSVLQPDANSQFRFAHMAHQTGPVAVYVNREAVPLYNNVDFSSVTAYTVTGQGPHLVEIYPVGTRPTEGVPLAAVTAGVGANQNVVVIAQGSANALQLHAYAADLAPLPPDSTRLHVIHAAPGNPAARLTTFEGLPLLDRVAPGTVESRVVPAGAYSLRLTDADSVLAEPALLMEKSGIFLQAGTATQLIIFDNDPAVPLVNALAVAVENVPVHAAVRWLHAGPAAGAVDVYLDDAALFTGWNAGDTSDHLLLPPAIYALRVYPAGADPASARPVIARNLDLTRLDTARTTMLFGPADDLRVTTIPDSAQLIPADTARVRVINAAPGLPGFDVQDAVSGELVVAGVTYGSGSVHVNLAAGETGLQVVQDGSLRYAFERRTLAPGTSYTFVVLRDDSGALGGVVLE